MQQGYSVYIFEFGTYSRAFSLTSFTPMFPILISPLPHLMLVLQLLHKMIYVSSLSLFLLLWSFFLPLKKYGTVEVIVNYKNKFP